MHDQHTDTRPPLPAPPPEPGTLARPLTIFLTADEHRAAVRALRRLHSDRARALRIALRLDRKEGGRA